MRRRLQNLADQGLVPSSFLYDCSLEKAETVTDLLLLLPCLNIF